MKGSGQRSVVAVKSVTGSSGIEIRSANKLQPGDVVEQLRVVNNIVLLANAPFSGGKAALQSELRKIYNAGENVIVKVRRGSELKGGSIVEVYASVVVDEGVMRKKQYFLADVDDKNRLFLLMDASEEECYSLQEESRKADEEAIKSRITKIQMKDCLVPYTWQKKMQTFLPCPNSGMVFSVLLMPFQPNRLSSEVCDIEETAARAMAWLSSAQTSGVPITFLNIQIEPILLQASGSSYFGSSSKEDLPSVNSGKYIIQDWEGTDIHIIRAVRLWFAPAAAELAINLNPSNGETRLGVGISRTEEGFCYVSSVEYGSPADQAGLKRYYNAACAARKLLVISRVAGEKVTPWTVNSSGSIRCFDTVSISEKLSAHRHARQPIQFHVILWDGAFDGRGRRLEGSHSTSSVTDEFAPVGLRNSHSNPMLLDLSPGKYDRHHTSIADARTKKSERHYKADRNSSLKHCLLEHSSAGRTSSNFSSQDLQADRNDSAGNVHPSSIFYHSPDIQMESMSREWARERISTSSVHQSRNFPQDGETSTSDQSNNIISQAASTLESAVTAYPLAVEELKHDGEENEFSFSF